MTIAGMSGKPTVRRNVRAAIITVIATALWAAAAREGSAADKPAVKQPAAAPAQAVATPAGAYQLTADELKLECPKLTGHMKVRIATMRYDLTSRQGSTASRSVQSVVTPVFGGTSRGIDPAADQRRDRAKLDAYNRRLAEKKCKTLDIDAELRGDSPASTPASAKPAKRN